MITTTETIWLAIGVLIISLSFTTYITYLLGKEIMYLQNYIKRLEAKQ